MATLCALWFRSLLGAFKAKGTPHISDGSLYTRVDVAGRQSDVAARLAESATGGVGGNIPCERMYRYTKLAINHMFKQELASDNGNRKLVT
jgi:hypothetical protein